MGEMSFSYILLNVQDGIATIVFNRPSALNALNLEFIDELNEALDFIENSENILGVLFTGNGRAFMSGADIKEIPVGDAEKERKNVRKAQDLCSRIASLEKPTIAAVNGFALGAGDELALACDIRIASEEASFGQPEVTLGVNACYGGTQRLPRLVGAGIAKELMFTGRRIKADEALAIHLVNRVVPADKLMEESISMMKRIIRNAPIAIKYTKMTIDEGMEIDLNRALELERDAAAICITTEDLKEGVNAFIEKRHAVFINK